MEDSGKGDSSKEGDADNAEVVVQVVMLNGDTHKIVLGSDKSMQYLMLEVEKYIGIPEWQHEMYLMAAEKLGGCDKAESADNTRLVVEDTFTESCTVFLYRRDTPEHKWSPTLRSMDCDNFTVISENGKKLSGESMWHRNLSKIGFCQGVGQWKLQMEGANNVLLGVTTAKALPDRKEDSCSQQWGIYLCSRHTLMREEIAPRYTRVRSAGPDAFETPCQAVVSVDCDQGTLSMQVGGVDLGVLSNCLPKDGTKLHLMVATANPNCICTFV